MNFKNSAKDAIASLINSSWTENAPYAAMTHTNTQSSSYLHECAHTAATLDKLVRNWASGESLTLSVQLGPPDRSYTLNSVDSKESNLWLSQSGLIRSVRLNIFGRRLSEAFWWFLFWPKVATGQKTSSQLRGWSRTGICVHQVATTLGFWSYNSFKPWLTQTMINFLSNVEVRSRMLFCTCGSPSHWAADPPSWLDYYR